MTILGELQSYNLDAWVELFVLEIPSQPSPIYFCSDVNEMGQSVIWQGQMYQEYPISVSGMGVNGQDEVRPTLTLSNVTGLISGLVTSFGDLVGSRVTRKRTKVINLDAANFSNGNSIADPNSYLPDEIYFVNQKVQENKLQAQFELTSALDFDGFQLPRRQVIANICPWVYRGGECGYAASTYFDADDNPVTTFDEDVCGKRPLSCRCRFNAEGGNNPLPFGGFPGARTQ
ncbi:phage minor tail protein L [Pseudescherichia vulneris]